MKTASCSLKILDMDLGEIMEDRARMVRTVIAGMKGDVYPDDRRSYERIMRRTRVIILGRKTVASSSRGRTVYTVPVAVGVPEQGRCRRSGCDSEESWLLQHVSLAAGNG